MKFYISYFAQFRNMTPKQICFSTAIWDPKWFHDFADQKHKFVKDGKIYGLRASFFNSKDSSCQGMPCPYSPKSCKFLQRYAAQLSTLDFNRAISALKDAANDIAKQLHVEDPDIVLLVHETPSNLCSERHAIINWFKSNGVTLHEWKKEQ